jgi:hypothetical protein
MRNRSDTSAFYRILVIVSSCFLEASAGYCLMPTHWATRLLARIETIDQLYAVLLYMNRNAQCAGLVKRPEQRRWSSLRARLYRERAARRLHPWPVPEAQNGISWVADPQTEAALAAVRRPVNRGRAFGLDEWVEMVVRRLGLQATVRTRRRARKDREMIKKLWNQMRPF